MKQISGRGSLTTAIEPSPKIFEAGNFGEGMVSAKPARANRRSELKFAKQLRAHATDAERKLWGLLRNKRIEGLKFRRQHPIGPYVVDFFCAAARLIVELDGNQHGADKAISYDAKRTRWLEDRGYQVLRFANIEVRKNSEEILERIWRVAKDRLPLPEPPAAVRPSLKGRVHLR